MVCIYGFTNEDGGHAMVAHHKERPRWLMPVLIVLFIEIFIVISIMLLNHAQSVLGNRIVTTRYRRAMERQQEVMLPYIRALLAYHEKRRSELGTWDLPAYSRQGADYRRSYLSTDGRYRADLYEYLDYGHFEILLGPGPDSGYRYCYGYDDDFSFNLTSEGRLKVVLRPRWMDSDWMDSVELDD